MNATVTSALIDVDAVVLVIEASRWTEGDEQMLNLLPPSVENEPGNVILAINKSDLMVEREQLLPLMADSQALFDAVEHLRPTILTGLPLGTWAAPQKVAWAERHFPGTPIITCLARDKVRYMETGDVLVDDREDHRDKWEAAGGLFVHHRNAVQSLDELTAIFPSVGVPG